MNKDELMRAFGKKVRLKIDQHGLDGEYRLIEYHLKWTRGRLQKSVTVEDDRRTTYTVPIEAVHLEE